MLRETVAILCAGILLGGLVAPARTAAQSPSEVQFSATGVGRVAMDPDFAIVVFTVHAISKTAQGAITENAASADVLTKQLRGFVRPGDRIETAGFGLARDRGAFLAVSQILVRTLQIKEVGRLIDLAVRGGAEEVSAVSFGREHTKDAAQQAVRQAMQAARENAGAVAAGLGLRSVRIVSIEPSLEEVEGPMAVRSTDLARAVEGGTQIQPGLLTLSARVTIRFVLSP